MGRDKKKKKRGLNREAAQRTQGMMGGGPSFLPIKLGDMDIYTAKKGRATLAIVPYAVTISKVTDRDSEITEGDDWYERRFWVHRNVGPENKTVICPARTFGKKCPICEEQSRMAKDEDADEDEVKSLRPRQRSVFNIIDVKEDDSTVLIMEGSFHNFAKLLKDEWENDDDGEFVKICDPEDGVALKVRWAEESLGSVKYLTAASINTVDRDDYTEDILSQALDLDASLIEMSYDQIKDLFQGSSSDDDDDGEDESPKKKSKRTRGGNKKDPEPEKDDDGDDDKVPEGQKECPACEGSGKNTKGKECRICEGDGHVEDDSDDDSDEEEPPKKKEKKKDPEPEKDDDSDDDDGDDDDNWDDDDDDD